MSTIDSTAIIHPTAIVEDGAVVGAGCSVGPYSIITARVVLGANNRIGPHVVIEGNTHLGEGNHVFQFASVGSAPQDLKFEGEESVLEIGSRNIIREYVTMQPGTAHGLMRTVVGNDNLFMASSHVAHDVVVGNSNWFANSAALAGHLEIGNHVILGGLCGLHQFIRIGDYSMIGGGAMVSKDVPPYCVAQGDRARLVGLNRIGLKRHGFSDGEISLLKRMYREVFSGVGTMEHRVQRARQEAADNAAAQYFLSFFEGSERGVTFPGGGRDFD